MPAVERGDDGHARHGVAEAHRKAAVLERAVAREQALGLLAVDRDALGSLGELVAERRGVQDPPSRVKSRTPYSASTSRMAWETAGCDRPSRRPAAAKVPASATERMARRRASVSVIWYPARRSFDPLQAWPSHVTATSRPAPKVPAERPRPGEPRGILP